jgi:hypothetical protein
MMDWETKDTARTRLGKSADQAQTRKHIHMDVAPLATRRGEVIEAHTLWRR